MLGCPHPIENSGKEAQTNEEKIRFLEFSIANMGHLVSHWTIGRRLVWNPGRTKICSQN